MPGVYAVGDTRVDSREEAVRVGAAVGDGQQAVRSVHEYFNHLREGSQK